MVRLVQKEFGVFTKPFISERVYSKNPKLSMRFVHDFECITRLWFVQDSVSAHRNIYICNEQLGHPRTLSKFDENTLHHAAARCIYVVTGNIPIPLHVHTATQSIFWSYHRFWIYALTNADWFEWCTVSTILSLRSLIMKRLYACDYSDVQRSI